MNLTRPKSTSVPAIATAAVTKNRMSQGECWTASRQFNTNSFFRQFTGTANNSNNTTTGTAQMERTELVHCVTGWAEPSVRPTTVGSVNSKTIVRKIKRVPRSPGVMGPSFSRSRRKSSSPPGITVISGGRKNRRIKKYTVRVTRKMGTPASIQLNQPKVLPVVSSSRATARALCGIPAIVALPPACVPYRVPRAIKAPNWDFSEPETPARVLI